MPTPVAMNLPIYFNAGNGAVSSNVVSLQTSSSSFESDPPIFTLVGNTIGGPPTTYSWRRNGQEITNNGSYNISLMLDDSQPLHQVHYTSTLNVTGYLPGVYEYSVINRAMTSPLIGNVSVEGMTLVTRISHLIAIPILEVQTIKP